MDLYIEIDGLQTFSPQMDSAIFFNSVIDLSFQFLHSYNHKLLVIPVVIAN